MVWSPIHLKKQQQKEQWRWGLEVKLEEWGWTTFEKEGIGNIGGLHKIRGLALFCQLCKDTPSPFFLAPPPFLVKISHPPHYSHFWKVSSPLLYEGGDLNYESICNSNQKGILMHVSVRAKNYMIRFLVKMINYRILVLMIVNVIDM